MTENDIENKIDKIIELLEEILKWTKFQGWRNVKNILLETLKDDISKLIYHYSDGSSSREIAEKALVSHATVLRYWKKWARIPIVEPVIIQGKVRYRRMFPLEDFGIELPKKEEVKEK